MNFYRYVRNCPTNAVDPTGLLEHLQFNSAAGRSVYDARTPLPPALHLAEESDAGTGPTRAVSFATRKKSSVPEEDEASERLRQEIELEISMLEGLRRGIIVQRLGVNGQIRAIEGRVSELDTKIARLTSVVDWAERALQMLPSGPLDILNEKLRVARSTLQGLATWGHQARNELLDDKARLLVRKARLDADMTLLEEALQAIDERIEKLEKQLESLG